MARRAPARQLDLFAPEAEEPLVFQVACHYCDPPRIVDVVPVADEIVPGWPVPSPWGVAEKFTAAFPGEVGPPFVVDRGVLMESKLSPRGARYGVVETFPMAGQTE